MKFELIDIESIITTPDILIAHRDGKLEARESLNAHMGRSIKYFEKLCSEKKLLEIIKNIVGNIELNDKIIEGYVAEEIVNMFVNAIWLHDIGKLNPAFQHKLKNTDTYYCNDSKTNNSEHSILSALIYIDIFLDKVEKYENKKVRNFLRTFIYNFSYVISRHHTYLDDMEKNDYLNKLKQAHKSFTKIDYYLHYYKEVDRINKLSAEKLTNREKKGYDGFDIYILTKLLYSNIVACDFYATYFYMNGNDIEFNYINNIDSIIKEFNTDSKVMGIDEYRKDKTCFDKAPINSLRSELFIEAEEALLEELDKNIYYLEAPTGSGKTLTSINLALNIIKNKPQHNKLFYIFPFNVLVEQTKAQLDGIFKSDFKNKVAVINSITPIKTEVENSKGEECIDYDKFYIDRQFIHYPVVITSHVNFFNYLFGTGREINLPLIHLCNSVVILDEIQSYKITIWPEIIRFLDKYSKLLNIKIIIMSATLPKLDNLLTKFTDMEAPSVRLIKNRDVFFKHKLFKDRVKLNYDLLKLGKIDETSLFDNVTNILKDKKNRVLIEFISKRSAESFYKKIKEEYPDREVFLLTGDDNKFTRGKVLDRLNSKDENNQFKAKNVILIATQVIEAGVDIDMDIGFKDISMLDNEEQFLGRLNRSCSREEAIVYFFDMDDAKKIYRGELRLEKDLKAPEYQQLLLDKDFDKYYELCFMRLYENKNEANANNINGLYYDMMALNYKEIQEKMKLIDEKNYEIYIPYIFNDKDITIDGREIWNQYKALLSDNQMNYSEKMIKLSCVVSQMQMFLFKSAKMPMNRTENIGNIYYVENGEQYIVDGYRFDREEYEKSCEGDIL